ncbi:MAG: site-specific DNA-methyltransferase [Bacteroidota bacterium]
MLDISLQYPGKQSPESIRQSKPEGSLVALGEESRNQFYFGDNLSVLSLIRERFANQVDLIYLDPPFGTGQEFAKPDEAVAYTDHLPDYHFLEFLRQRLFLLHDLLSERGSLYLHIDKKIGHYVKLIMDEVFGYDNHLNDLTRIKCNPKNFSRKAYGNYSDMILFYAKNRDQHIWEMQYEALTEADITNLYPKYDPERGAYTTHPLHAPGETRNGDTGQDWKGLSPPKGRHWRYKREVLDQLEEQGLIEWSSTGNPRKKVFAADHPGKKIQDVWEFKDRGLSYVSYPTEKNHELLARIIQHSSLPDSLVMDPFAGSGSFLLIAERLGRPWLGIDQSPQSRHIIRSHLTDQNIAYQEFEYRD